MRFRTATAAQPAAPTFAVALRDVAPLVLVVVIIVVLLLPLTGAGST